MRALPFEKAQALFCDVWLRDGIVTKSQSPFIDAAVELIQDSIERLTDATPRLTKEFDYPLLETLQSEEAKSVKTLFSLVRGQLLLDRG